MIYFERVSRLKGMIELFGGSNFVTWIFSTQECRSCQVLVQKRWGT